MADEKPRRAALGFHAGGALSLRLSPENLKALQDPLSTHGGSEIQTEDGAVRVDLGQVVYVRVESDEHRVGF